MSDLMSPIWYIRTYVSLFHLQVNSVQQKQNTILDFVDYVNQVLQTFSPLGKSLIYCHVETVITKKFYNLSHYRFLLNSKFLSSYQFLFSVPDFGKRPVIIILMTMFSNFPNIVSAYLRPFFIRSFLAKISRNLL